MSRRQKTDRYKVETSRPSEVSGHQMVLHTITDTRLNRTVIMAANYGDPPDLEIAAMAIGHFIDQERREQDRARGRIMIRRRRP